MKSPEKISRRDFIKKTALGVGVAMFAPEQLLAQDEGNPDLPEKNSLSAEKEKGEKKEKVVDLKNIDLAKDFDLGELPKDFELSAEAKSFFNSMSQERAGDKEANYKKEAFEKIAAKFGEKGIAEFFGTLKEIHPLAEKYQNNQGALLKMVKTVFSGGDRKHLNKRLYVMAELIESDSVRKLKELFEILKEADFKKSYDLSWDSEKIAQLISDSDERKAMIEYNEKFTMAVRTRLKEKINLEQLKWDEMPYKDRMKIINGLAK